MEWTERTNNIKELNMSLHGSMVTNRSQDDLMSKWKILHASSA